MSFVQSARRRVDAWSTLVEGGKERYRPPGKLTLELVHANQNKLLCLWTMQLTKWAGKVPYLLLLKCSMVDAIVKRIVSVTWDQSYKRTKILLKDYAHLK